MFLKRIIVSEETGSIKSNLLLKEFNTFSLLESLLSIHTLVMFLSSVLQEMNGPPDIWWLCCFQFECRVKPLWSNLRLGVLPPCVRGSHDTSLFNNLPACELSVCWGETRGWRTKRGGGLGSPSALCGNLVGGVQLGGGMMGPCGPT